MKAMILAAGLGTRLKPFTDHHPKALAVVNGKTILQRNIEYLQQFKVDKIIINVHHFADQIISFLQENNNFNIDIQISDETQEVLETGGGLLKAKWFFEPNESFVLMNVDILTDMNLQEMLQKHTSSKAIATLAISRRESARCFLFNDDLLTLPVTDKPKMGSWVSIECPPAKATPARSQTSRAPCITREAEVVPKVATGHPKMAKAICGLPPMAHTSLNALVAAMRPKS